MSDILHRIVQQRRARIEELKQQLPLDSLLPGLQKSERSFADALRAEHPAFILECKKASPSSGAIRAELDWGDVARAYGRFASAVSILTEPDFFSGSFDDLREIGRRIDQPLLCKDFICDPFQVYLARHFGADAILLILAALDDHQYRELAALARQWNMDVLTEVASAGERDRAVALGASIVGINNRNLHDLTIDANRTRQLAPDLRQSRIVISESGYRTNAEIRAMAGIVDGFLVGSSLMAQPQLAVAVKRLIFGDNKICGLTRASDAAAADAAGAVFGGVIFAQGSPRQISPAQAAEIFAGTDLIRVGVFQNSAADKIQAAVESVALNVVQLHGDETIDWVRDFRRQLPQSVDVWKAISVDRAAAQFDRWLEAGASRLLIDTMTGQQQGGTGRTFDWSQLPIRGRDRMMLAGGIDASNIRGALQLGVAGIDVNSGAESSPGLKSPQKITEIFGIIRRFCL